MEKAFRIFGRTEGEKGADNVRLDRVHGCNGETHVDRIDRIRQVGDREIELLCVGIAMTYQGPCPGEKSCPQKDLGAFNRVH